MASHLVTCPETAQLVAIEVEDTDLGKLILRCSRFDPSDAVSCPRTCAARADRRDRAEEISLGLDDDIDVEFDLIRRLR
jgi:hypothetical protein